MLQKYIVQMVSYIGGLVGFTGIGSKMLENPPQK